MGCTDSGPNVPVGVGVALDPLPPVLVPDPLPPVLVPLEGVLLDPLDPPVLVPLDGAVPDDGLVLPIDVGLGTGVGDDVGDDGGISCDGGVT